MKILGFVLTAAICLTAGFLAGRALQERQTIAKLEIVNGGSQPLVGFEIVTKGAALEAGQRREIYYGMRGESGYDFKALFADGSSAEARENYLSSGDRKVITVGADKRVSVADAP